MASLVHNPDGNKHTRILRLPEVMARIGESRSNVYRLDKKGILLRAKHLDGSSSAGWHEDSVDALVESRRPDPISLSIDSGQTTISKAPAVIRRGYEAKAKNLVHKSIGPRKNNTAKASEGIAEMHLTGMVIMGAQVYFHSPTGKFFLELGKAQAFVPGINGAVDEEPMDDAEFLNAADEPAIRKRRAASL